jgi:hypothetical protein
VAVPWYTPPIKGDTYEEIDSVIKYPIVMKDAIVMERAWRNMSDKSKKFFIKHEYVLKTNNFIVKRKLNKQGIKIKSFEDYEAFNYSSLLCLYSNVLKLDAKAL